MKEVKIEIPTGYEIDKQNSTFTNIIFKPINKKSAKTWEEIQEEKSNAHEIQFFLNGNGGVDSDIVSPITIISRTKSHVPTHLDAERLRALCQALVIAEYYNDGWKPMWDNKTFNYQLYAIGNGEVTVSEMRYSNYGFLPIFKSKKLAQQAYENNREIFDTLLKP